MRGHRRNTIQRPRGHPPIPCDAKHFGRVVFCAGRQTVLAGLETTVIDADPPKKWRSRYKKKASNFPITRWIGAYLGHEPRSIISACTKDEPTFHGHENLPPVFKQEWVGLPLTTRVLAFLLANMQNAPTKSKPTRQIAHNQANGTAATDAPKAKAQAIKGGSAKTSRPKATKPRSGTAESDD